MLDRNSKFFLLSKEVAEKFLQTTVIVDDQASFGTDTKDAAAKVGKLTNPNRGRTKSTASTTTSSTDDQDSAHQLDAKVVIDSFANKGIVCSVLKPDVTDKQRVRSSLEKLANCTDILIIDWDLCDDDGEQTLKFIETITQESIEPTAQLRLIVVYTGAPKIVTISTRIKKTLQQTLGRSLSKYIEEDDDGFAIKIGSTRITVFAKPNIKRIPSHYEHRRIAFDKLAEVVTEEFACMTSGLVSNVVLHSLAAVRMNTYKILGKFGSELDPPYLTHRALMHNPIDSEEHLSSLIGEELQGILNEAKISDKANLDAIDLWCQAYHKLPYKLFPPSSGGNPVELDHQQIIDLLKNGPQEWTGLSSSQKKQIHKHLFTDMFKLDNTSEGSLLDEKFAVTTTHRSYYGEHERVLRLGTIVKYKPKGKPYTYYVCVQPRCDSTRIDESRQFPFLPLIPVEDNDKFDTVICDDGSYLRLKTSKKPYDLKLNAFAPTLPNLGVVVSKKGKFKDITGKIFYWVGELRFEHAQRLSNILAAEISRVGLDESEWLRRWSPQ